MKLISVIQQSIHSPEFYRELQEKPFSYSLKYFFSLVLTLSLVFAVFFSVLLLPQLNFFFRSIAYSFAEAIPDDLVVTIRDGRVSVNKAEPFYIEFPSDVRSALESLEDVPLDHFIVIDTASSFSFEKLREHRSLAWIMADSVALGTERDVRIFGLGDAEDIEITKPLIETLLERLRAVVRWLAPLVVFGIFFAAFGALTFSLVYFLVGGLIVWAIARIRKIPMRYGKAYQVAIHASTAGILFYATLFLVFSVFLPISFPAILLVSVFVGTWVNLLPQTPNSAGALPASKEEPPTVV